MARNLDIDPFELTESERRRRNGFYIRYEKCTRILRNAPEGRFKQMEAAQYELM